jgi:hypothetical protein
MAKSPIKKAVAEVESTAPATDDPFKLELDPNALMLDFRSLGSSGLNRFGGIVMDEYLPQLAGQRAAKVYKEMLDNDPTIFVMDLMMDRLIRSVPFYAKPASLNWRDQEAAQFLESCMFDMESPWTDFVSEAASCHWYGFHLAEKVYKRRCGNDEDPSRFSKHADGRVGWRDLAGRAQETIWRWHFDRAGYWRGCVQVSAPDFAPIDLWKPKLLLFRAKVHKQNPEGRATLRGAYRPWYFKQKIENFEAIGVERDLVGLPKFKVPIQFMQNNATVAQKSIYGEVKDMVTRLRINQQAGIVLPSTTDRNGKELFDFELVKSGGPKSFDTDKIINRYDTQMARVSMMDFLMLGTGASSTGSWSMHSDKTRLFCQALETLLDSICQVLNNDAVPSLFRYNQFEIGKLPEICHGKVSKQDLKELGEFIKALAAAGMTIFPNPEVEKFLCDIAGIPPPTESETFSPQDVPVNQLNPDNITEIHDTPEDKAVGVGASAPVPGEEAGTDTKPQDAEAKAQRGEKPPIKIY